MYRYRVDFYIDDKIIGRDFADGWTRHDAYVATIHKPSYKKALALAKKKGKGLMWDATRLTHKDEI